MKIIIKNENRMLDFIQEMKATYIAPDVFEEWTDYLKEFAKSLLESRNTFDDTSTEYSRLTMDNYWIDEKYYFDVAFQKTNEDTICIDLDYECRAFTGSQKRIRDEMED